MVNRHDLVAYLLHQMPESERLDFAERWFAEADLSERLNIAEAELMDAYVRGELPRKQRVEVERYLLSSDVQRRKLEFTAALHGVLPARRRASVPWMAVCAAAIIVVLIGLTLWIARKNRELRSELARLELIAEPLPGGVYSASLLSSGVRGSSSARSIAFPKDARMLRLDLELSEGEIRGSYTATLSISGRRVWREEPLHPSTQNGASSVTTWIPANVLESGNYTLVLETDGRPVVYYSLAIVSSSGRPER
jgi:hypothetical protein